MSITAGYLALPSPGRCTSPTRFTPSLAGIVTSGSVVIAAACAGAAASRPPASASAAATRTGSRSTPSRVNGASPRRAGSRRALLRLDALAQFPHHGIEQRLALERLAVGHRADHAALDGEQVSHRLVDRVRREQVPGGHRARLADPVAAVLGLGEPGRR